MEIDEPKKEVSFKYENKPKPKEIPVKPEIIKEQDPGLDPGYYYNEKNVSSFKCTVKDPRYQYFGSTAKRFISLHTSENPGPGSHDLPPSISSNGYYQGPRIEPFSKGDTRFRDMTNDELPGPGAYDLSTTITPSGFVASAVSFHSAFGSGLTRFAAAPKQLQVNKNSLIMCFKLVRRIQDQARITLAKLPRKRGRINEELHYYQVQSYPIALRAEFLQVIWNIVQISIRNK